MTRILHILQICFISINTKLIIRFIIQKFCEGLNTRCLTLKQLQGTFKKKLEINITKQFIIVIFIALALISIEKKRQKLFHT